MTIDRLGHRRFPAIGCPLAACSALLAAALAPAQSFTSPAGYLTTEGPYGYYPLCALLPLVNQVVQVDATLVGSPRSGIDTMAWRRDGGVIPSAGFRAQTLDVELRMAHASWSAVQPGVLQDLSSLVVGGFTSVLQRRTITLPDWQVPPPTLPAPWDFRLPLDTPWSYDGRDALLWQMQIGINQISTETPVDAVGGWSWAEPKKVGAGCRVTGMPGPMTLYGQLLRGTQAAQWWFAVDNAPPSTPVFLGVGLNDPGLDIGACALAHSSAEIIATIGTSSTAGFLRYPTWFPHAPGLAGVRVWAQAFAADPGQPSVPFAFSQALEQVYPPGLAPHSGVALGRCNPSGTTTWGWSSQVTLYDGRAIVTGMTGS